MNPLLESEEEADKPPVNKRSKATKSKKGRKGKGKAKAGVSYSDIEMLDAPMDVEDSPEIDDDAPDEPDHQDDIADLPPHAQQTHDAASSVTVGKKGQKGSKGQGKRQPTARASDDDIIIDEAPARKGGDSSMDEADQHTEALPRPKPRPKPIPAKKATKG
jgi:hypothetical protein